MDVSSSDKNMYCVKDLIGNRIKPTNERFGLWLLTENLADNNLVTDIGNVNYTIDEERLLGWAPLTDMFCDNIMLVKITDFGHCEGDIKSTFKLNKDICGSFNTYLRGVFKKFTQAKHGVKAKLPFSLEKPTKRTQGILEVIDKDLALLQQKYKNPVVVPYKIDLADVKLEVLLEALPEILETLAIDNYYLLDLDITQDFSGIFNKREMCEYLTKHYDFVYAGEWGSNVIVNNDTTVGIDCLTWLNSNSRIKIYNKFVCQITSPGVTKQIGNHIIDFISCPDKRLKQTFAMESAQNNGITRLEATIYNYGNGAFDPIKDCKRLMEDSISYFQSAPFYAVPLSKMWSKLTNSLQNSCCVVYNDLLQYVYWGNANTKKLTGVQIKLPDKNRDKLIQYALSAFSFNCLPINYIEIMGDKINITHKCYIKSGDTLFTKSSTPYSTIASDIDITKLGLIESNNVIPQVLRKRTNITNKLLPYPVKEIPPLSTPYIVCARKRSLEMEEMATKRRKLDFIENTASVKEQYKVQLKREYEIMEMEKKLIHYFKCKWLDLDCRDSY